MRYILRKCPNNNSNNNKVVLKTADSRGQKNFAYIFSRGKKKVVPSYFLSREPKICKRKLSHLKNLIFSVKKNFCRKKANGG